MPKSKESDTEVTEITESSSSSVHKKSRLDDDDDTTTIIQDDGKIWSKPLGETRETTRLIFYFNLIFILLNSI